MKQVTILLFISLALFSCRSTRNIARTSFPVDSTATADSLSREKSRAILEKVQASHISFKTFSAELKMDYEDSQGKKMNNLGVNIRMLYDSIIWVRVSGPLNVEGARILITKDSIKIVNRLEGTVTLRNAAEAQEMTQLKLSFTGLQDLIVGNPVFLSDSIGNIVATPSTISFASVQPGFTSLFSFLAENYTLQQSKVTQDARTGELTYGAYKETDGRKLAFERRIYVEDKHIVKVALDFKKAEFDKADTYPFPIPAKYTRQ